MSHIIHIEIDDSNLPPPTPEIEQERKVAIFDLLEKNLFELPKRQDRDVVAGPYRLARKENGSSIRGYKSIECRNKRFKRIYKD